MKKKVMARLEKCYSIAPLTCQGRQHILVAAEKHDRCILFDAEGNEEATVWTGPGGVMTMVQIPGTDGQFLATHEFYSPNDSGNARIVLAQPEENGAWTTHTLCKLPFVHRFDILESGGVKYLLACTLKSGHACKDDWSSPGKVYGAALPEDLSGYDEEHPLPLTVLREDMLRNHGYTRVVENGHMSGLVGCESGVYRFYPPEQPGEGWRVEQLLSEAASDAALIDLDGDGVMEMVVISPFHGDEASIYRLVDGAYTRVYTYPEKADFLHAIWAGTLAGKPVAILGYRRGARRLMAFTWDAGERSFVFKTIDEGRGPANAFAFRHNGIDTLIAANRETDEIAMYTLEEGDL